MDGAVQTNGRKPVERTKDEWRETGHGSTSGVILPPKYRPSIITQIGSQIIFIVFSHVEFDVSILGSSDLGLRTTPIFGVAPLTP